MALSIAVGVRWFRGRLASRDRARIEAHLEVVATAEQQGDFDHALAEIETALRLSGAPEPSADPELTTRRDAIARLVVTTRLDRALALPAAAALETLVAARDLITTYPALADLAAQVNRQLHEVVMRRARELYAEATATLDAGQASEAFDTLRAAADLLDRYLPGGLATSVELPRDFELLATRIAQGYGVVVEPLRATFFLGSPRDYQESLLSLVEQHLKARGFVLRPEGTPWGALWDRYAPDRLTIAIVETPFAYISPSALNASQVDLTLSWTRDGRQLWQGHTTSRTRMPPPSLPAYLAARYATATRRDPDAERQLYRDALTAAIERLVPRLQGLPGPPGRGG